MADLDRSLADPDLYRDRERWAKVEADRARSASLVAAAEARWVSAAEALEAVSGES
jgi:hypothetical protein